MARPTRFGLVTFAFGGQRSYRWRMAARCEAAPGTMSSIVALSPVRSLRARANDDSNLSARAALTGASPVPRIGDDFTRRTSRQSRARSRRSSRAPQRSMSDIGLGYAARGQSQKSRRLASAKRYSPAIPDAIICWKAAGGHARDGMTSSLDLAILRKHRSCMETDGSDLWRWARS